MHTEEVMRTEEVKEPKIRIKICAEDIIVEFFKESIVVGRSSKCCDLIWKTPYISRMHVRITKRGTECYVIKYLNSANGTIVQSGIAQNMIAPEISVPLSAGDAIILAGDKFVFM